MASTRWVVCSLLATLAVRQASAQPVAPKVDLSGYGQECQIKVKQEGDQLRLSWPIGERDHGVVTPTHRTWPDRFEAGYRAQMRAFLEAARAGAEPAVSGEDGLAAVRAVRAANRSWREQAPVTL